MKKTILFFITASLLAVATEAAPVTNLQSAATEINAVLKSNAFAKYQDYTVARIEQGESSYNGQEGQAYVVRLVKPFATDSKGICLTLMNSGSWIVTYTESCDK